MTKKDDDIMVTKEVLEEAEFAKNLSSLGYDESALQKDFANDKYISSIYKRLQTDKYFVAKNM